MVRFRDWSVKYSERCFSSTRLRHRKTPFRCDLCFGLFQCGYSHGRLVSPRNQHPPASQGHSRTFVKFQTSNICSYCEMVSSAAIAATVGGIAVGIVGVAWPLVSWCVLPAGTFSAIVFHTSTSATNASPIAGELLRLLKSRNTLCSDLLGKRRGNSFHRRLKSGVRIACERSDSRLRILFALDAQ